MYFSQINSKNSFVCFCLPHFFGEYPHLGWVAIDKNAPRASPSTFTNFKFWSPNFHLQKCLETADETVKLLLPTISNPKKWRKKHIPEMGKRKCCFVSVYLPVFMFTCYPLSSILLYFDHFARHLTRLATVILHTPARLNILLGCTCSCVSETTSWRNWSTPSWPFRAAQHAGNHPSPAAAFKVSGTTSWRNWSSQKKNCKKLHGIPDRGNRFI